MRQGRFADAISECRKAATLEPRNHMAHYNLGVAYLGGGQYAEAVVEFRRSLDLGGADLLTWSELTVALAELGRRSEALATLARAEESDLGSALGALHLSKAALACGDLDRSAAWLARFAQREGVAGLDKQAPRPLHQIPSSFWEGNRFARDLYGQIARALAASALTAVHEAALRSERHESDDELEARIERAVRTVRADRRGRQAAASSGSAWSVCWG